MFLVNPICYPSPKKRYMSMVTTLMMFWINDGCKTEFLKGEEASIHNESNTNANPIPRKSHLWVYLDLSSSPKLLKPISSLELHKGVQMLSQYPSCSSRWMRLIHLRLQIARFALLKSFKLGHCKAIDHHNSLHILTIVFGYWSST